MGASGDGGRLGRRVVLRPLEVGVSRFIVWRVAAASAGGVNECPGEGGQGGE